MKIKSDYSNEPQWKEVNIKSSVPAQLECLDELAHNMWWAWNYEARNMFKSLDEDLYEEVGHNPVLLLERLSYNRKEAIIKDKALMKKVNDVYKKFKDYMSVAPDKTRPSVAYFSMEYGINQVLKIYSGGLGMLAATTSRRLPTPTSTSAVSASSIVTAISSRACPWTASRLQNMRHRTLIPCLS